MKKAALMLIAVFALSFASIAQNQGPRNFDPKEMAKRQTEELTKQLDLNKDQQKKVLELNEKYANKMSEMRNGGGDREAMREKMTKMREEQNKEMKKILTEDQYKKYEKYLEERRSRRGQGGPGGPGQR